MAKDPVSTSAKVEPFALRGAISLCFADAARKMPRFLLFQPTGVVVVSVGDAVAFLLNYFNHLNQ